MENALVEHDGRWARVSSRRPGVLVRAWWGERRLESTFIPLGKTKSFTVGTGPGVDFALAGFHRFELVRVGPDGAAVRFTSKLTGARVGPDGETPLSTLAQTDQAYADGDGHAFELEGRDVVKLSAGNIRFEVFRLSAPPMELPSLLESIDFTWANLVLVLFALAAGFVLYAANREAEGEPLGDDLSSQQLRLVKIITAIEKPKPAVTEAALEKPAKDGKLIGPAHEHLPPRPNTATKPGHADMHQLVTSLFAAPGTQGIFGKAGLGDELAKNIGGIVGNGLAGNGLALKDDGSGLGGTLEGIGRIGSRHGHGGRYGYGTNAGECGMNCKPKLDPDVTPDPPKIICGDNGSCLDKELIRKVIHANAAAYRYCYESRLNANPKLSGKVAVRFGIDPLGKVPTATVAQSTVGDTELDACVLGRTRLLQFPSRKSEGLVLVTYPFVFHSGAQ